MSAPPWAAMLLKLVASEHVPVPQLWPLGEFTALRGALESCYEAGYYAAMRDVADFLQEALEVTDGEKPEC